MYSVGWVEVLNLILLIWLIFLSYFFWREKQFLRQLFPKDQNLDIRKKFEEVLGEVQRFGKKEQLLKKDLEKLKEESLEHYQIVEVLRYNPYADTGGQQSFTIVLLNAKLDGILITSLHSRAGTRVYTKVIKNGKSEMELSKEEGEVLKKAIDR